MPHLYDKYNEFIINELNEYLVKDINLIVKDYIGVICGKCELYKQRLILDAHSRNECGYMELQWFDETYTNCHISLQLEENIVIFNNIGKFGCPSVSFISVDIFIFSIVHTNDLFNLNIQNEHVLDEKQHKQLDKKFNVDTNGIIYYSNIVNKKIKNILKHSKFLN